MLKESLSRLSQVKTSLTLIITHHHDRVAEEQLEISSSDLRLKLRVLLRPSSDSFIPKRLDNTCEWIWSHSAFNTWLTKSTTGSVDYTSRMFCLYVPKGCGKSVLVKSVAEKLRDQGELAGAFLLLNYLSDSKVRLLMKLLVTDSNINERNVLEAVQGALGAVPSDVYCVIDGVDESTNDWNIRGRGCYPTVIDLVQGHPKLHLLVAGREPSMRTFQKDSRLKLELDDALTITTPETKQLVQTSLEQKSQVILEEIRHTLDQVPHDLDREYHRLLLQLMARTGGSPARPSPSMKRARLFLSSILASPEPLMADELRYAYTTHVNNGGPIEDDLVSIDGIIDACGDFIRVTDGRYHLTHTSVADFLTRPLSEWSVEDSDILYFRIDRDKAQQTICSVCVGYIKLVELGYPLTDGGASTLPSRYPFFSYATRLVPYYLARVLDSGDSSWGSSTVYRFAKTPQACALLEYALATQQSNIPDNDVDLLYYWSELLYLSFEWRASELMEAYGMELQRRQQKFGAQDKRYLSWQALSALLLLYFPNWNTETLPITTGSRLNTSDRYNSALAVKLTEESPLPTALSHYVTGAPGLGLQKVSQNLFAVSKLFQGFANATTDLITLSTDSLPVPLILLMEIRACARDDFVSAERLASIAVRKTRNKGNYWECISLSRLGYTMYQGSKEREKDDESIKILRECIDMANRAAPRPHFLATKSFAYSVLVSLLIRRGLHDEAAEALGGLYALVGKDRAKSGARIFDSYCRTDHGIAWRMERMRMVADEYDASGNYTEAIAVMEQVMAIYEKSGLKTGSEIRQSFLAQVRVLYQGLQFQPCIDSGRRFLEFLEKSVGGKDQREDDVHWRRKAQLMLASSFAIIEKMDDARALYRQAADGLRQVEMNERHEKNVRDLPWLATDLALAGEYERSAFVSRKILESRKVSYDEKDKEAGGLCKLQSLVGKLQQIGFLDSHYTDLLHCLSLLKAVDQEGQSTELGPVVWWREKVLQIADNAVPSFCKKMVIPCLKIIDTLLCLDDLDFASAWYRYLVQSCFEIGCRAAAELVAADGASRYFADPDSPLWRGLVLQASASLYSGRLLQRKLLMRAAWENSRCNCPEDWETVLFFAEEHIGDAEHLASDNDGQNETTRQLFLRQACAYFVKATERSKALSTPEDNVRTAARDEDDGSAADRKEREELLGDLKERLDKIGAGSLLDEATAESKPSTPRNHQLRRVKSFAGFGRSQSRPTCWRDFNQSRSLESVRGLREPEE
ncbi:uncharacterized protein BJX67DRAFT_379543 [Aspergillus lucknowensis]|uniref:Nephrocystin 3-like N-terminal domain-containing protein n=1 Tax=Aspergillus lucknowensis TaxID=176173 RepID=A0ABR4LX31_9EURO